MAAVIRAIKQVLQLQVHRPWVTEAPKVLANKVFFPAQLVKHTATNSTYQVAFLSKSEMQKLADYNFQKWLYNFHHCK